MVHGNQTNSDFQKGIVLPHENPLMAISFVKTLQLYELTKTSILRSCNNNILHIRPPQQLPESGNFLVNQTSTLAVQPTS